MAKSLTTFAIAEMLHVDPGSVANWIDNDMLKAHRTPGGHRRVASEDLVEFLGKYDMPVPAELDSSPPRVLIVDDEPAITRMLARALKNALPQFEIIEAHDGFRAGGMVATEKPAVVLLDLRMPGMDGYEVCRLIKSQDSTKNTQVLAMTAYPSPESEKEILKCGAKVCMSKPLDLDMVLKEVRAAF